MKKILLLILAIFSCNRLKLDKNFKMMKEEIKEGKEEIEEKTKIALVIGDDEGEYHNIGKELEYQNFITGEEVKIHYILIQNQDDEEEKCIVIEKVYKLGNKEYDILVKGDSCHLVKMHKEQIRFYKRIDTNYSEKSTNLIKMAEGIITTDKDGSIEIRYKGNKEGKECEGYYCFDDLNDDGLYNISYSEEGEGSFIHEDEDGNFEMKVKVLYNESKILVIKRVFIFGREKYDIFIDPTEALCRIKVFDYYDSYLIVEKPGKRVDFDFQLKKITKKDELNVETYIPLIKNKILATVGNKIKLFDKDRAEGIEKDTKLVREVLENNDFIVTRVCNKSLTTIKDEIDRFKNSNYGIKFLYFAGHGCIKKNCKEEMIIRNEHVQVPESKDIKCKKLFFFLDKCSGFYYKGYKNSENLSKRSLFLDSFCQICKSRSEKLSDKDKENFYKSECENLINDSKKCFYIKALRSKSSIPEAGMGLLTKNFFYPIDSPLIQKILHRPDENKIKDIKDLTEHVKNLSINHKGSFFKLGNYLFSRPYRN